jgi:hypothetical protein
MAVKYWLGKSDLYEFDYDGGAHSPVAGETINVDGEEGDETAVVQSWTNAGGWAGAGTGKIWVYSCSATFIANLADNDVIEDSGGTKICDTTGGVTARTSGDWQLAGNWGTGEGPAVPLADDEVIFDGRSTLAPTEGMLDGESGAVAQCTFDLLHFKSTWTAGVAGSAEPLVCAPDKIVIDGTGTYYICNGMTDQNTNRTIGETIVNNADATVYLYSNCNDGGNTCTYTDVYLSAGTLYAAYYSVDTEDCGCYIANLYVVPQNNRAGNATVYIEKDAYKVADGTDTNIKMQNGFVYCDSSLDTVDMIKGTFYYGTDLGSSPETGLNILRLNQYGGTFYWRPDDSDDDAYLRELWLFGGTFDASSSTNNDRAKVLGTAGGYDMTVFPGATLNLANGKGNITLAANCQIRNYGGTITLDRNAEIGLTYDT